MSAVTIRDIAKASGLSIGTVSRGLRQQPGLSAQTRQTVLDWAAQLGYDLSQLRRQRVRRVGFLLHSQHNTLASSPFFSSVLHGAEAVCRREGLTLSFIVAGPTDRVIDQARVQQLDAYLCAGYFEPEILDSLRRTGKPMVLVDMHRHGIPSVNPDHQHGAFQATSHLLRTGAPPDCADRRFPGALQPAAAGPGLSPRALRSRHPGRSGPGSGRRPSGRR